MTDFITQAIIARENSYSPYSKFKVGAAVEMISGEIYTGCNIENASYGLTICAERTAIFKAVSFGERYIKRIAISCQGEKDDSSTNMPCGACLQVMTEFSNSDIDILIDGVGEFKLSQLLPKPFNLK